MLWMMCMNVDANGEMIVWCCYFMLLYLFWSYVLKCIFTPFVVVVWFVGYVLVGYRYSRREALVAGRLEGGNGSLSFVVILLVNNYATDYVL